MIKNFFISSTFSDMHSERDIIRSRVIPRLRAQIYKRGIDVKVTDLRWGIKTEDDSKTKARIITVCLIDIENCMPCFIVLLGDRYGTVPDIDSVNAIKRAYKDEFLEVELEDCSITEIEILHALNRFETQEKPNIIVCFRDPLDADKIKEANKKKYLCANREDEEKLSKLKDKLRKKYPKDCISYSATWDEEKQEIVDLSDFEEKLYIHILDRIESEYGEEKFSDNNEQDNLEKLLLNRYTGNYADRKEKEQELESFMQCKKGTIILYGESGSGKSALLRHLYKMNKNRINMVYLSCGYGKLFSAKSLLDYLFWKLGLDLSEYNEYDCRIQDYVYEFTKYFNKISPSEKHVVIIDGLDILKEQDSSIILRFLKACCKFCVFVVSTTDVFVGKMKRTSYYSMISLDCIVDYEDILNSHLKYRIDKELQDRILPGVKNIIKGQNPLFISLLCDRINMLTRSDYEAIRQRKGNGNSTEDNTYNYIAEIVDKQLSIKDLVCDILDSSSQDMAENQVWLIIAIVCEYNYGIRMPDMLGILKISNKETSELDIRCLVYYLEGIFNVIDSDMVLFRHDQILSCSKEILHKRGSEFDINKNIFQYLLLIDDESEIKIKSFIKMAFLNKDASAAREYIFEIFHKRGYNEDSYNIMQRVWLYSLNLYQNNEDNQLLDFSACILETTDQKYLKPLAESYLIYLKTVASIDEIHISSTLAEELVGFVEKYEEVQDKEIEYDRIKYRVYELVSIYGGNIGKRREFAEKFYNLCYKTYYDNQFDQTKRDIIIDDFGHASSKLALSLHYHEWEKSVRYLDDIIEITEDYLRINGDGANLPIPLWANLINLYLDRFTVLFRIIDNYLSISWNHKITPEMRRLLDETVEKLRTAEDIFETKHWFHGKNTIMYRVFCTLVQYDKYASIPVEEDLKKAKHYYYEIEQNICNRIIQSAGGYDISHDALPELNPTYLEYIIKWKEQCDLAFWRACLVAMGEKSRIEYEDDLRRLKRETRNRGYMRCRLISWIRAAGMNLVESNDPDHQKKFLEYACKKRNRIPGSNIQWFSLLKVDEEIYKDDYRKVGEWICENYNCPEVKKMLEINNLFELAALETAYIHDKKDLALKIIRNGYKKYLELSHLYIIQKYDREEFLKLMNELPLYCLTKIDDDFSRLKKVEETPFCVGFQGFIDDFHRLLENRINGYNVIAENRKNSNVAASAGTLPF